MPWIKRNLYLVISGLVALALLGFAIFFLLGKMGANREVTEQLEMQTAAYSELLNRPVHPGNEKINNIQVAKEEAERLKKFATDLRAEFGVVSTNKVNNQQFRFLLDTTVSALQREADLLGVTLPTKDYWFTFSAQRTVMNFDPKSIDALTAQLDDVARITRILYNAKVHSLSAIKRVPVAREDTLGAVDYTSRKAETNNLAVIMPYEVTFTGFTSELDAVLDGLINGEQLFVVKTIGVDKHGAAAAVDLTPAISSQYNRYGRPPPVAPTAPTVVRRPNRNGLTTILDENKLKFTLLIEVVKLRPPGSAPIAAAPVADPLADPAADTSAEIVQ